MKHYDEKQMQENILYLEAFGAVSEHSVGGGRDD